MHDREMTDEETMAWLTGYLCEEVHTFINKTNGGIGKGAQVGV
jgi:hypothetical protein